LLPRYLMITERIKLFKEIDRVHREIYGWKTIYENAWYGSGRIDIESDMRFDVVQGGWIPMGNSDAEKYYFQDDKGKDIPSLRGIFAWQAYHFHHLNPYRFLEPSKKELVGEDFISDGMRKRIRPDITHPVNCLGSLIEVQQRREDGKIWISSIWIYHHDCYGSTPGFGGEVYKSLNEAAGGDEKVAEELQAKYEEITDSNGYEFEKALERYFRGGRLQSKNWYGGYLFAASKERRIKTLEQLNEVLEEEDGHFRSSLEEFVVWLRSNGLNLGEKAEESLRRRARKFYDAYPCNIAKELCQLLAEEDKIEPSDVNLWWGGEPNSDSCYAFLTLFFEVDPEDIGTHRFDEIVSRNLKVLINVAEKSTVLSSYREYEPKVWRVVFP